MSDGRINLDIARQALDMLEIDELGLDKTDRHLLETIIRFYNGGPVGLEALAATIGEEATTLEDVCEPYLLQIGFLARTLRGRMVTQLGYEHLGIPYSKQVEREEINEPVSYTHLGHSLTTLFGSQSQIRFRPYRFPSIISSSSERRARF